MSINQSTIQFSKELKLLLQVSRSPDVLGCNKEACQWDVYTTGELNHIFLKTCSFAKLLSCIVFTNKSPQYGSVVESKVHFYGSAGVCIFKYLVTCRDPQHIFSLAVLLLNCCCFALISLCYFLIQRRFTRSGRHVNRDRAAQRRQQRLQTKITVIILTDFCCWIPLTVVCALHFAELIDASSWYSVFSVVILPINSLINPLLYDSSLAKGCLTPLSKFRSSISSSFRRGGGTVRSRLVNAFITYSYVFFS